MSNFEQYELPSSDNTLQPLQQNGDTFDLRQGNLQSLNFVKNQKGWRLNESGLAEFLDADIGGRIVTLSSSGDLQAAINELSVLGGGTIALKPGTYTISKALTGASSVSIEGSAASSTILNFNSTSYNLSFTGTSIYTTGTLTAISGVNVTGSGTSWLANVTTSHQLFIGTRWYKIAAVTSNTAIVLAESYGDNVTLPTTYRAVKPIIDINLKEITLQSSTGTALALTDCRNVELNNVNFISNNKGFVATNVSEINIVDCVVAASTSNGYELTNCGLINASGLIAAGNGGHGGAWNNVKTATMGASSYTGNTTDGLNCTTVSNSSLSIESSGNGGQGIEFVSNCNNNFLLNTLAVGNTSDGIKYTASSDGNMINGGNITSNGAYGINIADSTCDNNTIIAPYLASNTSGTINDSGTGTIQILTTGTNVINIQSFTSSGTWTKPASGTIAYIQAWGAGGSGGKGSAANAGGGGGGAGAYNENWIALSSLTSTVTVTIGAGGPAQTSASSNGTAGGNTTFGSYLTAYGGGRGGGKNATSCAGGGGGGELSAGGDATDITAGTAGSLFGAAGGAAGAAGSNTAGLWGGGGGGGANNATGGGKGIWGGGGGGGGENNNGAGGTSLNGGAGGAGGSTGSGVAGTQPGGGGGGTGNGTQSGKGGDGKMIVYVF